ncbi:serine/threonine protein kinase [Nocardia abscessus]|uniref:serine/threonine-protein kinase n=1 Tax=Nocardia abscessus TaxID=120957 RepID=UPI001895F7FF|nr:serine/threonine-protein kinase [Nocardia abscessus]MBF6340664.1 serine/threonine protein kinase [Nocardia abscessus]
MEHLSQNDPTTLGTITLKGRLGRGGMGAVYYGITEDLEAVAVKTILESLLDRGEVRARFTRELEALRTVQSPHVATLLDSAAEGDDRPWLAIEFIRGLSLKEYVETSGTLTTEQVATLGLVVARALADIHAVGLLHRDLKPGNILMGREGPMVIDLGLVAFSDGPTDLTHTDLPMGTAVCMAPEQVNSPKHLTATVDVYALGATLLYTLTKRFPFNERTTPLQLVKLSDPNAVPDLAGVPESIGPLLAEMLAFDPAARPSVEDVHDRLMQLLSTPVPVSIRNLAVSTFIRRDSDPEEIAPAPRPGRKDLTEVAAPGTVIHELAERLRNSYAATAKF